MKFQTFIPLLLLLSSCATQAVPVQDAEDARSRAHMPGLAYAVIRDGALVQQNVAGYADTENRTPVNQDTRFMLASVSKLVTATAVMQLYEQGKLSLDEDIRPLLPFPLVHPDYPEAAITFRMLLTHSSGIRDRYPYLLRFYTLEQGGDSPYELEDFLEDYLSIDGALYTAKSFHPWEPGSKTAYCNVGFGLLGYLVERISGMSFPQYCRQFIFEPLEMNNTGWLLQDTDQSNIAIPYRTRRGRWEALGNYGYPTYPDGQLRTSIADFGRFLCMYLNQGSLDGRQVLQPQTVDLMFTISNRELSEVQGLAWTRDPFENPLVNQVLNAPIIGHTGGDPGIASYVVLSPEQNAGFYVFANGNARGFPRQKAFYIDLLATLGQQAGILSEE